MKTTDFYSSATGTLQVKGGRDENAPQGVSLSIDDLGYIKQGSRSNEGSTGTSNYNDLSNKPLINSVELKGNKSLNDLGIQSVIDSDHKVSADNINDTNTTNKFATAAQLSQIETNKNNILLKQDKRRIVMCGTGQTYTRIRDAVAYAVQVNNSLVYVLDGTYDLCTEFATEIAANVTNQMFGVALSNDVEIVFSSKAKVVANYTGGQSNITTCFQPFYAVDNGGYTVSNLTIDCKNTRYCIHDEAGGFTKPRIVKIVNCNMKMDNTTAAINYYPQCIGGGLGVDDNITIDNCIFDFKTSLTDVEPAVSYHNNGTGNTSKSNVVISNCQFENGTVQVGYYGESTEKSMIYVNNCLLQNPPIIKYATSTTTTPENMMLISQNNFIISELANFVDNSAKNRCPQANITAETTGFTRYYDIALPKGDYTCSFNCSVTADTAIALYHERGSSNIANRTFYSEDTEVVWDFTISTNATVFRIYFNAVGDSVSNLMICRKDLYYISPSFIPYTKTNLELTEQEEYNTKNGVKNLLHNTATSGSQKGVTYTVNSDGTVTTSDSTTSNYFSVTIGTFTFEQGKTYYITGCPMGGSTSGFSITNTGATYFYDTGNGATVVGDGQTRTIVIYVDRSGTNMDGLTFKPMIREIGDDTYQPYAMTNAEITAWILSQS